jgi:Flp pilus assembly protein CpaB
MKHRLHPLTIIGIVLGLIAFIGALALLNHPTPKTDVVVAATALPARTVLSSSDLRVTAVPTSVVPPDALSPDKPVVGDVLVAPVWPGEILVGEQVQQGGARAALSAVLAPGDRAFAVEANVAQALAGQIAPGD